MAIQLMDLPYPTDSLQPCISQSTVDFHYREHHRNYVNALKGLIENTHFEGMELEEIVLESASLRAEKPDIFNNAAQVWNHDFYWRCMAPHSHDQLSEDCYTLIRNQFGSLENLKTKFTESAKMVFGSGWTWLVKNQDESLEIVNTHDADNPLVHQQTPLLVCDVWEHAYYLDYQNGRDRYLSGFMKVVNWDFVEDNLYRTFQGFHRGVTRLDTGKNQWQNEGYV